MASERQHLHVFLFSFKTTGLKAAPGPQAAAHRSVNQASAEDHEVPAAPEGEALHGADLAADSGVGRW